MATLLGKRLSFCFSCVLSEKCFVVFYVFSFPPGVYVRTLNLIASIPGPYILTLIPNGYAQDKPPITLKVKISYRLF